MSYQGNMNEYFKRSDYTKYQIDDYNCNYLDLSKDKSEKMLLSCINYQNYDESKYNNNIMGGTVNGGSLIEGFSSDMSLSGGVSYVPYGECPLGYTKVNNQCHQVCRKCQYSDKKGYFGDKQSNTICGKYGTFSGISDNGMIKCKLRN